MFISKLGCPQYRGNHSRSSTAESKTLKSMTYLTSWSSKVVPVAFKFPLFWVDLDKKYKIQIEKDKK